MMNNKEDEKDWGEIVGRPMRLTDPIGNKFILRTVEDEYLEEEVGSDDT